MAPLRSTATRRPRLEKRLADEARFLKSWLENPLVAGAVAPSSRFLAEAMARAIDADVPGPIVELGPGTGPVTQALLARGVAEERLILVEFDPAFCALLAERFPRARIVEGDAYDLPRTLRGALDAAPAAFVSSLPLLTRPEMARLRLLADAFNLMRPDGRFVQFTYGMVSPIPRRVAGRRIDWWESAASPPVWLNIPPARVFVYRRDRASRSRRDAPLMTRLRRGADRVQTELRDAGGRLQSEIERIQSELKSRGERLQQEWREAADKAQSGLKEGAERFEQEWRVGAERVKTKLKDGAGKMRGDLTRGAKRLGDDIKRSAGRARLAKPVRPALDLLDRIGERPKKERT